METELRLDWFEATLECETATILAMATLVADLDDPPTIVYGRGRHGYKRSVSFSCKAIEFTILDLGNGGYPHIVAGGKNASLAKRIALSLNVVGRASRVDIACDSLEGWLPAEKRVLKWADEHPRSALLSVGDFYRQEKGRTYYVGASTSDRRIRIYEKGIQLNDDPNWVRVEFQYRPKGREAKQWAFSASIEDIANSSRAFVALRALNGFYAPPLYERAKREPIFALAHQYGRALREEVPEAYLLIIDYLKRDWRP